MTGAAVTVATRGKGSCSIGGKRHVCLEASLASLGPTSPPRWSAGAQAPARVHKCRGLTARKPLRLSCPTRSICTTHTTHPAPRLRAKQFMSHIGSLAARPWSHNHLLALPKCHHVHNRRALKHFVNAPAPLPHAPQLPARSSQARPAASPAPKPAPWCPPALQQRRT